MHSDQPEVRPHKNKHVAEKAEGMLGVLMVVAIALLAIGAVFGAVLTMYSAVASRTREIATLRALGFGSGPVALSVLAEALVLALAVTENVASPSPRVLISRPPRNVTTRSTISSCRASAAAMASASASHAAVDPSMSVSKNVTARMTDET